VVDEDPGIAARLQPARPQLVDDLVQIEARLAADILVNNAGGPPSGDFREWELANRQKAVNANMLTPIMLIKAVIDGMCERRFGRIVNITLTGFVAGLARHNVTINNLLPGPFRTDRYLSLASTEARRRNIAVEDVLALQGDATPAGRIGDPEEFGTACAFLCAASSGFIVGQNLLLYGGAFNSTMG
jgi:3-oxoacyl-[acyl-carrier protein] reductase